MKFTKVKVEAEAKAVPMRFKIAPAFQKGENRTKMYIRPEAPEKELLPKQEPLESEKGMTPWEAHLDKLAGDKETKGELVVQSVAETLGPVTPEKALSSIDEFAETLGSLEGTVHHEDEKLIKTTPYGLVIDKAKNPRAYNMNKAAADKLGITLDDTITPENALVVSRAVAEEYEKILTKAIPEYKDLSAKAKSIVLDAKYNTGVNYKDLSKALKSYEETGDEKYRKVIVKESRRLWTPVGEETKRPSKGLDNRVAKLLHAKGYIKSLKEAKEWGLDKAATDEIPAG